ncbi:MAG: ABC transporter permease [Gemmatimonadota bacterium]|jgi:predicted permease
MEFTKELRLAVRSLVRRPGFTVVAALTLALGIGATTAIFSVVNAVLLRPLPYAHAERIVGLWERSTDGPREVVRGQVSTVDFADWKAAAPSFEAMAQYRNANITLVDDDGAEMVPGGEVSTDFFRVFGARPILGREFSEAETRYRGPSVAIVGHGFWQERLGGITDVVGSTLRLQGATYEIVGVAPEGFDYPNGARIWVPAQNDDEGCGRGCQLFAGVGLLRADATPERARAELETVASRLAEEYPESNTNVTADVAPLRAILVGDAKTGLAFVSVAVLMVLLIACANVANLLLVRGGSRRTEVAVRSVLGANRGRLLAQFLTESALLSLLGAAAGVILAMWGVEWLRDAAASDIPRSGDIALDLSAIGFAVLLTAVTTAIFGLAPALHLSRQPFASSLREGRRGGTGAQRGRSWILGAEVALSVALVLAAGLMLRSLARMRAVDPGFDPADVALFGFNLPDASYPEPSDAVRFNDAVLEKLRAMPGVEAAGFAVGVPWTHQRISGSFSRPDLPEPEPGEEPGASHHAVAPGYFATLGIPIVRGRGFEASDVEGSIPVAVISQRAADRYWPGEDPIGMTVDLDVSVGYPDSLPRTIVGIAGDVRTQSLTENVFPEIYVPEAQAGASFGRFVVRSSRPAEQVLREAREALASVDPQIPMVRAGTMQQLWEAETARQTFLLLLLSLFAALALTLASVGIYGVVAYVVANRRREIGVRMALGARARQVVQLVVWQGLRPASLGALAGLAGALAARRAIAGLLYEVQPDDPLTLAAVAVVFLAVVAIASAVPARAATRIPPASALNAE